MTDIAADHPQGRLVRPVRFQAPTAMDTLWDLPAQETFRPLVSPIFRFQPSPDHSNGIQSFQCIIRGLKLSCTLSLYDAFVADVI